MVRLVRSYRDLLVWQRGVELAESVYVVAAKLPASERFELAAQMRRSAVSIPSNIAEGHGRKSTREYLRFLGIANGSLMELETQLILANRLTLLNSNDLVTPLATTAELSRMLAALRKSLQQRLPNP